MIERIRQNPLFDDNPLALAISFLLIAVLLAGVSLALFMYKPGSVGLMTNEYVKEEAYYFDILDIQGPYLQLTVGPGLIIPTYRGQQVSGAVILGSGEYSLDLPGEYSAVLYETLHTVAVKDQFTEVYLPGSYQRLQNLKDLASAQPITDYQFLDRARAIIEENSNDLSNLKMFGVTRQFITASGSIPVRINGQHHGPLHFVQGGDIVISYPAYDNLVLRFPASTSQQIPFFLLFAKPAIIPISIAIFVTAGALILLMIMLLTIDIDSAFELDRFKHLGRAAETLVLITVLGLAGAGNWIAARHSLSTTGQSLIALGLLVLVLNVTRARHLQFIDLGLTLRNIWRSVVSAALVGFAVVCVGTLSYPRGIQDMDSASFVDLTVWSFLIVGLARELLMRGYVLTSLTRLLGRFWGLVVTSLASSLLYFVPLLLTAGLHGLHPTHYSQAAIVFGMATLTGYLYQRTGNIAAPSIARGIIEFLPKIAMF